jgi:hypothetical protein
MKATVLRPLTYVTKTRVQGLQLYTYSTLACKGGLRCCLIVNFHGRHVHKSVIVNMVDMCTKVLGIGGGHLNTLCRDTGPGFDITGVGSRVCFAPKKHKNTQRVKPSPNHTYTPFFTDNAFFRPLHTLQTHFQHLFRETRPCSSVDHAKTRAFASAKRSKEQVSKDEKETWCLSLPSLAQHTIVFLCVSSIHPTLEPSLTSIPSLPIPCIQHCTISSVIVYYY